MMDPVYGPKKFSRDKSEEFAQKYPHHHRSFFNRPDVSRRRFFEIAGAGVAGSYLAGMNRVQADTLSATATPRGTARNAIFILLTGAISQVDSWDLKVTSGVTPSTMSPTMVNGVNWPMGLFPKIGGQLSDVAIVRSMSAWALVHSLAQTWSQIGRNPVAALGDIAPNIGSVVAIEKDAERKPGQVFPAFVSLNTPSGPGSGYFPASYAPFRVQESRNTASNGIVDTTNVAASNASTFDSGMLARLHQYDDAYRVKSPYGTELEDYNAFYSAARGLMYNAAVSQAFNFSAADSQRYGSTQFGNACLAAKQILAADQGTRFIQISFGSWDMHQGIYDTASPQSLFGMGPQLDSGLGALLADLKSTGKLSETLVVVVGEFGRTPGFNGSGRDHFLLQSALFAGGGIKGGKVIGSTSADGLSVADFGWSGSGGSGPRYVRPEDMESTIYSALGIDWTKVRRDDPFGRGFEYVPFAASGAYGPINELFG